LTFDSEELKMDETTENWPTPEEMADDFRNTSATHRVQTLPVFHNEQFVDPVRVNSALKNALVEVHFCLRHYRIQEKGAGRAVDSFSAIVQQIVILKEGVPKPMNPYKRKNVLDGPYKPKPFRSVSNSQVRVPEPTGVVQSNAVASSSKIPPSVKDMQTILDFPARTNDHDVSPCFEDESIDTNKDVSVPSSELSDAKGKQKASPGRPKKKKTSD
jgi:hypothetical protein